MASKYENGNILFEELKIGQEYLNLSTGRLSIVKALTSNTVEMFNKKSLKSKYKDNELGEKDKLAGIDSTCWYEITLFNRLYRRVDNLEQFKWEKIKEFMYKKIKSGMNWNADFFKDYL